MKKFSDVFKSIRFAKLDPSHDKPHKGGSQDDEEHYTVGEKEWEQQVKHVKKRAMQEEKKDKYDEGEYDREGDMAKSDLRSIMANAKRLHDMIGDADNLPEWCQNKITIAEDYISTVANYMTAEMNESVADTLAQRHSDLRKKSGLPHPDYYKELGKSYDIEDDKERLSKQSEIKKKYKVESYVPSPHAKPVPKKPKGEYERKVDKYLKKKYNKEEVELSEGRPSQRHPLEGHEYHKKSNAELIGIAKDAHAAAEAMKGHSPQSENKYRDQANDSATVRYFRQKSGMPNWYKKKYGHVKEEMEQLEEKNVPTNPSLWSKAKSLARSKFDVYPSAYANGWASKWYKSKGGGWKSVSEETISESRKTEIIKKLVKKKTNPDDKFEPNPVMLKTRDDRDH
jgi:hypothetical protein